jgi:gluconate kinase
MSGGQALQQFGHRFGNGPSHGNNHRDYLKRAYRQITIGTRQGVRLVFLKNDEHVVHARIGQRQHRYMPCTLLRSQFETLEAPSEDEHMMPGSCALKRSSIQRATACSSQGVRSA